MRSAPTDHTPISQRFAQMSMGSPSTSNPTPGANEAGSALANQARRARDTNVALGRLNQMLDRLPARHAEATRAVAAFYRKAAIDILADLKDGDSYGAQTNTAGVASAGT